MNALNMHLERVHVYLDSLPVYKYISVSGILLPFKAEECNHVTKTF